MTATSSAVLRGSSRSTMQRLKDAWFSFREARERRRAVREMQLLDNRTLKDIGINRSEIMSVVHGNQKDRRRRQSRP